MKSAFPGHGDRFAGNVASLADRSCHNIIRENLRVVCRKSQNSPTYLFRTAGEEFAERERPRTMRHSIDEFQCKEPLNFVVAPQRLINHGHNSRVVRIQRELFGVQPMPFDRDL